MTLIGALTTTLSKDTSAERLAEEIPAVSDARLVPIAPGPDKAATALSATHTVISHADALILMVGETETSPNPAPERDTIRPPPTSRLCEICLCLGSITAPPATSATNTAPNPPLGDTTVGGRCQSYPAPCESTVTDSISPLDPTENEAANPVPEHTVAPPQQDKAKLPAEYPVPGRAILTSVTVPSCSFALPGYSILTRGSTGPIPLGDTV